MEKFGNWTLTHEWIESENARIPLDSISYVGSLDLMKHLRIFFMLAALFFGFVTIIAIVSGLVSGALIAGLLCGVFIVLYNQNSTTFVVISDSGYMIQQTSGKIKKGDGEYEVFLNKLFTYRRQFMNKLYTYRREFTNLKPTNFETQKNNEVVVSNIKSNNYETNPTTEFNANCPACGHDIDAEAESCPKCKAIFTSGSTWKPKKKS